MSVEYFAERVFGNTKYQVCSFTSIDDAIFECHQMAFSDGNWRPRKIRDAWWKFWMPTDHSKIEKYIIGRNAGTKGPSQ